MSIVCFKTEQLIHKVKRALEQQDVHSYVYIRAVRFEELAAVERLTGSSDLQLICVHLEEHGMYTMQYARRNLVMDIQPATVWENFNIAHLERMFEIDGPVVDVFIGARRPENYLDVYNLIDLDLYSVCEKLVSNNGINVFMWSITSKERFFV